MAFEALTGINGDLITRSWSASKQAYLTERYHKEEAGAVVIFAFQPSFSEKDFFDPDNKSSFGEIKLNRVQFPCMRKIGKGDVATVNEAFLKNLEAIIDPRTSFQASVRRLKTSEYIFLVFSFLVSYAFTSSGGNGCEE